MFYKRHFMVPGTAIAVLQALIVGAFQDVSIQYIASYYSDYPPYVVVRSSARHCVLYDMKRICSAYEAKFSQLGKLILQEIFSQETVSCFLCFIFPSCLCSKTMIVTPVLCSDLVDRFQQCLHIQMGVYPFRQRHRT